MKNLLLALLAVSAVAFTSCGDDDEGGCQTCSLSVIIVSIDTEICQDGDNVITTTEGVVDTLFSTTVADVVSAQEAAGADCN